MFFPLSSFLEWTFEMVERLATVWSSHTFPAMAYNMGGCEIHVQDVFSSLMNNITVHV